ncbi:hypothetical protein FVER14953_20868 [Fusarium verticillioides]|nr:hypothetical protein FVER14953_20868 [Fusarium verticillioides]
MVFRGGYQVPARRGDGRAEMVEMQRNFMGMATASLWESVFRQATSLWSMSNAGAAFRGIDPKETTVSLGTKYIVLENSKTVIDEGLVLYSVNPFLHYSSHVSKDTAEAFGLNSFRPLRPYTNEAGGKLAERMKPRQSDVKTRNKLARNGIVMTRTNGSIGISTTRMLKAAAKRDEASSQKTVMGISAPELARA